MNEGHGRFIRLASSCAERPVLDEHYGGTHTTQYSRTSTFASRYIYTLHLAACDWPRVAVGQHIKLYASRVVVYGEVYICPALGAITDRITTLCRASDLHRGGAILVGAVLGLAVGSQTVLESGFPRLCQHLEL